MILLKSHFSPNFIRFNHRFCNYICDMWHFSLVTRYEMKISDYLTGLGNVKEFDRHLNHVSQIAEDKMKVLPYY